jgi:cellulose synthase/poly-beta-1,6-N-acetylglucosamine synthase-like glycosyltransferase
VRLGSSLLRREFVLVSLRSHSPNFYNLHTHSLLHPILTPSLSQHSQKLNHCHRKKSNQQKIPAPYFFWILLLLLCPQQRKRPKLRLRGDAVPAVDVMLTTCGEVVPMILDTALAACNIDYPTNRYRIIICDDDNDTALAEALQPMLAEYPQLFYQAREKIEGVPHHYKAGNLQFGIDFAAALEGGAGEFLATLDSDMIPHPEWLRALLPHLLRDEMLGLVSPPQVRLPSTHLSVELINWWWCIDVL